MGNFKFSKNGSFSENFGGTLEEESVLHLCGYNVNQTDDMSEGQRHIILEYLIKNHVMNKPEIIRYLDFFISRNGKKRNMEVAVSRWEDDVNWVRNYNMCGQRQANIRGMKKYRG